MQYQLSYEYPRTACLKLGMPEACVGAALRSIRCFVCPPPPIYRNLQRNCTFRAILAHSALWMLSRHAPCTWGWQGSCSNYYKHYFHLLCPPWGSRHRPPPAFCCDSPKHGPKPARSHRSQGPRPHYALCMCPGRPCHIQWAHIGHGGVLPGPGVTFYHHPG